MRALIISLCGILVGCGTQLPKVVEVPVAVPCVKEKPVRPALVTDADLMGMSDYRMALALRQHHILSGGYIAELEAVVDGCSRLSGSPTLASAPSGDTR